MAGRIYRTGTRGRGSEEIVVIRSNSLRISLTVPGEISYSRWWRFYSLVLFLFSRVLGALK
jgi:hypothetical protein